MIPIYWSSGKKKTMMMALFFLWFLLSLSSLSLMFTW